MEGVILPFLEIKLSLHITMRTALNLLPFSRHEEHKHKKVVTKGVFMEKPRKYDREFKFNAVKLYNERGKKLGEVADSLGIPKSTLYTWIQQMASEGEKSFRGSGNIRSSDEELYQLKKELADVKQERDILKKAVAIFSRPKA